MSTITIELSLDPADMTAEEVKDLEAHAHLARKSVPQHLADLLAARLRGFRLSTTPSTEEAAA